MIHRLYDFKISYIIPQHPVFEKNEQGGIIPETRWQKRSRIINKGHAETLSKWNAYKDDLTVLEQLDKELKVNGQTITDTTERQKIADKILKNSSQRTKDYGIANWQKV